ncbi:MAG: discoidin domain-containing protein [Candidatus Diapherotrites archaeon]|nr:discoidin domain-containing protein [Candidatus Diapherotrites archaeon]
MGFYSNLEKKWYKLVEDLDKKGIPIRAITDPIETAGLPSLPVVGGVALILVALVAFMLLPAPGATLTVQVTSFGQSVEGAEVAAMFGSTALTATTDSDGYAELMVPLDQEIEVLVEKDDCDSQTEYLTLAGDDELFMKLVCRVSPAFAACITAAESLDQAALTTPTGAYPRSCRVSVKNRDRTAADLGWVVSGKKLFLSYSDDNCPQEGQTVEISCDGYEYAATMERFIQDVQDDYEIELMEEQEDVYTPTVSTASYVYTATVTVRGDGQPASGIRVTAVDASGNPLSFTYSNIILQSTTGSDGIATLVLPENTAYYVKAEDTGTAYAPETTTSYIANQDKSIDITLEKGFETTITVLNARDNTPVANAYLDILDSGTKIYYGYSDADGKASFRLEQKSYTAKVSFANYMPTEIDFTGGTTSAQALLTPLDDTNSGYLEVEVINAHGVGEPLEDVMVQLLQVDEILKRTKTNDEGLAKFGRLLAGSYSVTSEEEGSDTILAQVVAGETTTVDLTVIPPQATLKVLTEVEGEPNKGVEVELYDITYSTRFPELVGSEVSGSNRMAEFTFDKGSTVYLKASFTSPTTGEQFGPVITSPIKLDNKSREYTIDVTGVKNNVEVTMLDEDKDEYTKDLEEGGNYYAKLALGLPYYDPQTQEPFSTVYVEFFTGGIGSLQDIEATPILIRDVALTDFVVEDPAISALTTADTFIYNQNIYPETTGASKYLRIDIANYDDAGVYDILIPLHVRSNVKSDNAQVSYRAFWMSPEGSEFATNGGKWTHVPVKINTKTSGWRFLEDHPYFYLYDAWLSTDKAGKNVVGDWSIKQFKDAYTFAEGSTFYLQFRAKARVPSNSYVVELSTMPQGGYPYAVPAGYSGSIERTSGIKQEIFPVTRVSDPSRISPPSDTMGSDYSLDADDELRLAIKMETQLKETGGISGEYEAQTTLLNDHSRQDLLFNVRDLKPEEETSVTNIIATEVVGSLIGKDPRFYDHTTEVIPSYHVPEYGSTEGRRFGALINFENADASLSKDLTIFIQDEHRTKGNQQPWAKFYKHVMPIVIGGELNGWEEMNLAEGDNVYTIEKQGFIWGSTLALEWGGVKDVLATGATLETGRLYAYATGGAIHNATVADNVFIFDYVPSETGTQTITVGMAVETAGEPKIFYDTLQVEVVDLPEMDVTIGVSPATVNEGDDVTISTTISNLGDEPLAILNYTGSYGPAEAGGNSLEPKAFMFIDGVHQWNPDKPSELLYVDIPRIQGGKSDTSIKFLWGSEGGGPKNITVCVGYFKYDGSAWNPIDGTTACDAKAVTIKPTINATLQDLGVTLDLNFTSAYKVDVSAINANWTFTNWDVNDSTNPAYEVNLTGWVTDSDGFLEYTFTIPLVSTTLAANESINGSVVIPQDFGYGKHTVTLCGAYKWSGHLYQDSNSHANCDTATFELLSILKESKIAGETTWFKKITSSAADEIDIDDVPVNMRLLVESGQYDDALGQLLLINYSSLGYEPTEEKLEYDWTLSANESDWIAFVGEGVLAAGTDTILTEASDLEIYLFESGADIEGVLPWPQGSFKHGWVDYDIELTGIIPPSGGLDERKGLDIYTAALVADIVRKDAENPKGVALGIGAESDSIIDATGDSLSEWMLKSGEGYEDDKNDDALLIPFSNSLLQYVRYLPGGGDPRSGLLPGNLTLYAKGDRFVVNKTFKIGGIKIEPAGPFDWDFTTNDIYSKVVDVTNYWDTPVVFGTFAWVPLGVEKTYGLSYSIDRVHNKDGIPQSDTDRIPPGGHARMTIKGSPDTAICSGTEIAYLEIPVVGGGEPNRLIFNVNCESDVAGLVGSQVVVRETADPTEITTGGCAITALAGGRTRASVCDAEQFVMAVLADAEAGTPQATYALGAEDVKVSTFQKVMDEYYYGDISNAFKTGSAAPTDAKELWVVNEDMLCGLVTVDFRTLGGGDIEIETGADATEAEWCWREAVKRGPEPEGDSCFTHIPGTCPKCQECVPGWPPISGTCRYPKCTTDSDCDSGCECNNKKCAPIETTGAYAEPIGYMNLDRALRVSEPGSVDYAGFRSTGGFGIGPFVSDLQKAIDRGHLNIEQKHLFSYGSHYNVFETDYDKSSYSFDYQDYYIGQIEDNTDFDWLTSQCTGVVGYLDISEGSGFEDKAVRFGLCYNNPDYRDDSELLSGYRQQLAISLVEYWTEGTIGTNRPGWNTESVWALTAAGQPTAVVKGPIYADLSATPIVTLDGSDSYDSNGEIVDYMWTISRGAVVEAEEYIAESGFTVTYDKDSSNKFQLESIGQAYAQYWLDIPDNMANPNSGEPTDYAITIGGSGTFDLKIEDTAYTSQVSLAKGRYKLEVSTTGGAKTLDYISLNPIGDEEPSTTGDAKYQYAVPGPGVYNVTLVVRDDDGIESNPVWTTLTATQSAGANLVISKALQSDGLVYDVYATVENTGGAAGTGVVSLWKTANRPETYGGCDNIPENAANTPDTAISTGEIGRSSSEEFMLETTESDSYLTVMVSGSGAQKLTCDYYVENLWVDHASDEYDDAEVTAEGGGDKAIDDSYTTGASWCNAGSKKCEIIVDMGHVANIKQIDTFLEDDGCPLYEGYFLDGSSDGEKWTHITETGRVSGTQHDVLDDEFMMRYIRYSFKKSVTPDVDLKPSIIEVNAYEEEKNDPPVSGTCGDKCIDNDGDGYGYSVNGNACSAEDPDDTDPCKPDPTSSACKGPTIGASPSTTSMIGSGTVTLTFSIVAAGTEGGTGTIDWGVGTSTFSWNSAGTASGPTGWNSQEYDAEGTYTIKVTYTDNSGFEGELPPITVVVSPL